MVTARGHCGASSGSEFAARPPVRTLPIPTDSFDVASGSLRSTDHSLLTANYHYAASEPPTRSTQDRMPCGSS